MDWDPPMKRDLILGRCCSTPEDPIRSLQGTHRSRCGPGRSRTYTPSRTRRSQRRTSTIPSLSQSHVSPQVEGLLSEPIRRRGTDHTLPLRGVHDAINAVLGGPTRRTVIYLLAATCFKHASNAKAVCLAPPGGSPLHSSWSLA